MTAISDKGLTRIIPEAGRSVRPELSVVRLSIGVDTHGILVASPLGGTSEHDGGLDRCLGGVLGALTMVGRSRRNG